VHFVSLIHPTTIATPACSAPDPEALLEALLARKLTAKMLVDAGKGQAQKWINDKLTPKESLLASMGAEDHEFMVILLTSNTGSLHTVHNKALKSYVWLGSWKHVRCLVLFSQPESHPESAQKLHCFVSDDFHLHMHQANKVE